MKNVLTLAAVFLLIAAFLYPLWVLGLGRPLSWARELVFLGGGGFSLYLLYKYRRQL